MQVGGLDMDMNLHPFTWRLTRDEQRSTVERLVGPGAGATETDD